MNYKQALKTYQFEDDVRNIPLLNSLYIYFDKKHHESGFNYIIIVGEAYKWELSNERGTQKRIFKETYRKIIARYSDIINIRSIDFAPFVTHGINLDYKDGELHIWPNINDRFKVRGSLLSNAEFSIVQESDEE